MHRKKPKSVQKELLKKGTAKNSNSVQKNIKVYRKKTLKVYRKNF